MGTGSKRSAILGSIGLAISGFGATAWAAPMDYYAGPAITAAMKSDMRACLNVGDAISCSAGMLNLIHQQYTGTALSATASTALSDPSPAPGSGYIIKPSGQGQLKQAITLGSGGNGGNPNGTIDPIPSRVENGFQTNSGGDQFSATGKTGATAGNLGDPTNNGLNSAFDQAGTWDVDLNWLVSALTSPQGRHELMFGFDYNQPQNSTGTVDYWALITVIDYLRDGAGNLILDANGKGIVNGEINFEIKNNFSGYSVFSSSKTFNSQPHGSEFNSVQTQTCALVDGGGTVVAVQPAVAGVCPAGYTVVNNATGDSSTEIIGFLPELNANLETYAAQGYDSVSVRMLFGCFNNGGRNDTGYLSGGSTTNCDGGGNVDVYLLAGAPDATTLPEPATLAIVGTALLAAGAASRRRRAVTLSA